MLYGATINGWLTFVYSHLNEYAMDNIFGDRWTAYDRPYTDKEGTELLEKLQYYAASAKGYMIAGIFNLEDAMEDVTHHMVGITGLPNTGGFFVFDEDNATKELDFGTVAAENFATETIAYKTIAISSANDVTRLNNTGTAYNIRNLKQIRVIEVFE